MTGEGVSKEKNWDAVKEWLSTTRPLTLGKYFSNMINNDLKHMAFTLSRYKFASKLLLYRDNIKLLELGCQEAIGALIFQQNNKLEKYVGIDFDREAIQWNEEHLSTEFEFRCDDMFKCKGLMPDGFDALVSLDVIEHIDPEREKDFCEVISSNLKEDGVAIIGTLSIMLSPYASEGSRLAHINLYDPKRLYELMNKYFKNVFMFNMNDEIVNMSFAPMACYMFDVIKDNKIIIGNKKCKGRKI